MNKFIYIILLFLFIIPVSAKEPETQCYKQFQITRNHNPWSGLTGSYEEEERGKHVKAISLPAADYMVPENLKNFMFNNQPWLARSNSQRNIIVNNQVFTDLERRDITRIQTNTRMTVGSVRIMNKVETDTLVEFLLQSHLIITYWHLESNLCVVKKVTRDDEVQYYIKGTHSYCTNSCHEDPVAFKIIIHRINGKIEVEGWN